jgi:dephospho-CoA kinase
MVIIGIGGLVRSGKDTLADMLIAKGFFGFSLGDYVRRKAVERHSDKQDPISVINMTETSNWLRETHGSDVVLKEALKEFEEANSNGDYRGVVLYSVRVPVEVDFILEQGGELVWVEASSEIRHDRGLSSLREGDPAVSLEEFNRQESLQWQPQPGIPAEVQMNISYVKDKATIVIDNNNGTLQDFERTATEQLKEYLES